MKEPDKHSNRPDLPSGRMTVTANANFTYQMSMPSGTIAYPRGSVVVASIDDPNEILPFAGPRFIHCTGWLDFAGRVMLEAHVEGAAVNLTGDLFINWMVLPPGGAVSAP